MATQAELVTAVQEQTVLIQAIGTGITKIGSETDTLILRVKELSDALANGDTVSPELQSAFDALASQVAAVSTAVKAVDEKVPDAPA